MKQLKSLKNTSCNSLLFLRVFFTGTVFYYCKICEFEFKLIIAVISLLQIYDISYIH